VNQFIEECRREWKRLRVPDPVVADMAAELTADLDEAAAEGGSPEDVLGSAASDPRSFAGAWAAERGVASPQPLTARLGGKSALPVAIAVLAIVAAVGAALVVFASPSASAPVAGLPLPRLSAYPTNAEVAQTNVEVARQSMEIAKSGGRIWVTEADAQGSGVDIHGVGSILLIAGIAGVILSLPLLFWSSSRRFSPSSPQT
jgi:hypothetical protein